MDFTHFHQHGYQVVRGLLDPLVVDETRRFLEAESEPAIASLARYLDCRERSGLVAAIDRESQRPDFDSIAPELRMSMSGHFPLQTRLSPRLWAIARQPRLREALEAALGHTELFLHMPPVARFVVPGNTHAKVPPHQDLSYNKHMSGFVTVWTPLVPIDGDCGGLLVYEGSADKPELLDDATRKFWFKPLPIEGYTPVQFTMDVGDVVLLNPMVIHGSMPNRSGRIRYSIDYRFLSANQTSTKHVLDLQSWKVIEPGASA